MAPKISDFIEDAGAPGAGIGAVLLAPVLLPIAAGVGKPLVKSVIKGGIGLYERSKGTIAEMGETWEDMVAEARAELADEKQTPAFEASATNVDNVPENGV